jgi:hypothetical protein
MKKQFPFIILLLLGLTSCIEIVEEITIYSNNSGKIKYRLETNQITSLINNLTGLLDVSTENKVKEMAGKYAAELESYNGIDSVRFSWNEKKSRNILEFSFSGADELNDAIYQLFGYKKNIFSPKYLKTNQHVFIRKNFSPWIKKYLESENIEIPEDDFLEMITYKTIIHYPKEVKKFRGSNIRLMSNGKQLVQTNNVKEVLENKTDVSIRCRL